MTRRLLIEGWRFLPHSYAVVNQFQCLELLRRAAAREIELAHRDVPYFMPNWQVTRGLFAPEQEAALASIPAPSPDFVPQAVYRIAFPYNLEPAPPSPDVPRICTFGTVEMGVLDQTFIAHGRKLADAHAAAKNLVIVTPSNWSRKGFINSGADPDRVVVIPHGVDPTIFHPLADDQRQAMRKQFNWNGFVFISVGAMTVNKGLPNLFKAFAAVATRYPDSILIMKGIDSLYRSKEMLLQQAKSLTQAEIALVQPRLHYKGETLSFADMATMYQLADAYVSPYMAEGFNMPVLEAAACGCPVIVTAGGSTDDFTTDDFALRIESTLKVGLPGPGGGYPKAQVLNPSLASLVTRMLDVMERHDFRARAREAGPAFVRENLTWKHVVDRMLGVLYSQ